MLEKMETEIRTALDQLAADKRLLPEINWFRQETIRFFSKEHIQSEKPELIILGEDFPWELALALSPRTRFILGGSLETTHWSDKLLPRDADPVTRSACGWLMNDDLRLAENALVVITLSSDNRKKLAGMLSRKGIKVVPVDLPPGFQSEAAKNAWVSEMANAIEAMEKHTRNRLSTRRLEQALELRRSIKKAIRSFKTALWISPEAMSCSQREFILESFWYTRNRSEWVRHLRHLTGQLALSSGKSAQEAGYKPWTLIAGSPIIFPNYKLPALMEDSGLYLTDRADSVAIQAEMPCAFGFCTTSDYLIQTAAERLPRETTGAFVRNKGLWRMIKQQLDHLPIEGIVFHVLKGQVEYDFELPAIEKLAAEYDLPVIRLETDYQQQDIEQLRIRLEAFSEMLRQRSNGKRRTAI